MQPEKKTARRTLWLGLLGATAATYAVFMPGFSQCRVFGFLQTFHQAAWGQYFEWTAMRGNFRFILFCLGLWLLIDAIGLWLLRSRRTLLGNLVFLLYPVPLLGLIVAAYFLLKSVF